MLTIFGLSTGCPRCEQAKNMLALYGYEGEWEYIELDTPEGSMYISGIKADGFSGAPAVYSDGDKIGGVGELQKFLIESRNSG